MREFVSATPTAPDLIFYDMFSSEIAHVLRTPEVFRKIFATCQGRDAELHTRACSALIRAALLATGFHLADNLDTIIALTPNASKRAARAYNLIKKPIHDCS